MSLNRKCQIFDSIRILQALLLYFLLRVQELEAIRGRLVHRRPYVEEVTLHQTITDLASRGTFGVRQVHLGTAQDSRLQAKRARWARNVVAMREMIKVG